VTGVCQDLAGNSSATTVSGINIDKTPLIVACSVNPNILCPTDDKLVTVSAYVTVTDSLSGSAGFNLVSVASSEPDSGRGDIHGGDTIRKRSIASPETWLWKWPRLHIDL